jgi:hypothetical protein
MLNDKMQRFLLLVFLLTSLSALAQDDEEPKKLTMKGYLKDMASLTFLGDSSSFQNLVHNRLNFAWYPNKEFTVYLEIRSRFVTGDYVKKIPGYATILDSNNDYIDMSANLVESKSAILNVMADRAYVQWAKNNWEVKAGRQRINWGVNLAWNPNDLFNAYSYFDFDYEERPGSDAMRISYYTGAASSIEVAAKLADDADNFVSAVMWKINKWNYDIQFLGGVAQGDLALGTGWAGNLGNAGFKGEFTFFQNVIDTEVNFGYDNMLLSAISVDYSFPNSLYLNGSIMYNSQGTSDPSIGFAFLATRPGTVRSLSPYKWSSFLQSTYQINPLLYGGLALIGYPGSNDFFINPTLTLSVKQNLDLDLIGQLFYGEDLYGDYGSLVKAIYLRLKWSF